MIYAGFFRRALALILDVLMVGIPTMFVFGPVLASQVFALETANPSELSATQAGLIGATMFSWQVVLVVLLWLYFAFFESGTKQATLGKQLLGIKVVGKDGQRISFARATGRFFAKILSHTILDVGFLMAGFTSQKRALHDFVAETLVVKKTYEEGQELPPTRSHLLALILVSAGWILVLLGGMFVSANLTLTPTQQAAQSAAQRLEKLAADGTRLTTPMRLETMTLFDTREGYRAVVTDPASNNKFTLLLPGGAREVCCLAFPFGDCQETGFAECK